MPKPNYLVFLERSSSTCKTCSPMTCATTLCAKLHMELKIALANPRIAQFLPTAHDKIHRLRECQRGTLSSAIWRSHIYAFLSTSERKSSFDESQRRWASTMLCLLKGGKQLCLLRTEDTHTWFLAFSSLHTFLRARIWWASCKTWLVVQFVSIFSSTSFAYARRKWCGYVATERDERAENQQHQQSRLYLFPYPFSKWSYCVSHSSAMMVYFLGTTASYFINFHTSLSIRQWNLILAEGKFGCLLIFTNSVRV